MIHNITVVSNRDTYLGHAWIAICSCKKWRSRREQRKGDAWAVGQGHAAAEQARVAGV